MHGLRTMNSSAALAAPADCNRKLVWRPYDNQMPFRRADLDKVPANAFGVYGFWYRKRCIYVGKAEKQPIARRLKQHWRGSHNPDLANWVRAKGSQLRVGYILVEKESEIDDLEKQYIKQFQPLTNRHRK